MAAPVRNLVAGLGNPGSEYEATRHNVGFRIVERFADVARLPRWHRKGPALETEGEVGGIRVLVMKPLTYMNRSGGAVSRRLADLGLTPVDLLLCYDEVALPLAQLRLRAGGSSAGHNGVESVIEALGTHDFPRLRFGVRPDHPIPDQVRFVLSRFRSHEARIVEEALPVAADAVECFLREGIGVAMNRFNRAGPGTAPPGS